MVPSWSAFLSCAVSGLKTGISRSSALAIRSGGKSARDVIKLRVREQRADCKNNGIVDSCYVNY